MLPEAEALCDYWTDHPPVHEMVASYFGIKPRYKDPDELSDPKAETERWLKMAEEDSGQDLGGLSAELGAAVKVERG